MMRISATHFADTRQLRVFIGIAVASVAVIAMVGATGSDVFRLYAGRLDPLAATLCIALAGTAGLYVLARQGAPHAGERVSREGFRYDAAAPVRGHAPVAAGRVDPLGALGAALVAVPFAVATILADVIGRFPRDINVPLPLSLAFYPVMGFIVEALFHVVPLALLLTLLRGLSKQENAERPLWLAILIVALFEPAFQVAMADPSAGNATGLMIYMALHLYLFNVFGLRTFARHGFIAMFSFRMAYYLLWHILWGTARLTLLF